MRRRLRRLTVVAACLSVLVPLVLALLGTTDEPRDRLTDLLLPDPPVSRDLLVVGVTDPRLWGTPLHGADDIDSDRLRFRALVRTIEEVLAEDPRLVVMTDVVTNEDLTPDDARALVELLATGRVLMPYLDDAPLTQGDDAVRRFRQPLSVTASLPLAHAVVETADPGDRVRTIAVTEDYARGGEAYRFVALPLAALATVATVPVVQTDDAISAGEVSIPLEDGRLRINFTDPLVRDVPGTTIPATVRDAVPFVAAPTVVTEGSDQVRDRIVLVGSIDPQQARYVPVPGASSAGVPELWVHANALNTVLVDAPLSPAGPFELALWLLVVVGGVTALTLHRTPPRAGLWLVPVGIVALVAVVLRAARGPVVDPVAVLLGAGLAWGGTVLVRYAVEGRQRRRVADLFRRYVPDAVAEQLIEEEVSLSDLAAGTRTDVTVVFCDLRGFTAQAGTLPPGQVRDLLNVYYRHITGAVLEHGGTVMQYVGDEVFSVFGAPLAQPDHVDRAVAAAVAMQDAADQLATDLTESGVAAVAYGIGVHTGPVVAAHVGDAARTQYAVVGDTVNVGARLCSEAGPGEVVVSEDVLAAMAVRPETDELGAVPMKGVHRHLAIHRLLHDRATHVPEG